jgi:dephospho-CoA kinase
MISAGLTGNIGAGKTRVAQMMRRHGAEVLDADVLVHGLLHEGGDAVAEVLASFPSAASRDGRSVDRRALGRIVFADQEKRRRLEGILHPMVHERQRRWLDGCAARGTKIAVVEATLMIEAWKNGGPDPRERFDVIIVVTCDEATQIRRAVARAVAAGASPAEAERDARARLSAQMPQAEKAAHADYVVDNSGDTQATAAHVDVLVAELLRREAEGLGSRP